jgi:hypothetical protein
VVQIPSHHASNARPPGVDGSRPRGHTSLTGAADAQIAVSRDEPTNEVVVTLELMKDGAEGDVITSRLEL